jgi:hypothetical protein
MILLRRANWLRLPLLVVGALCSSLGLSGEATAGPKSSYFRLQVTPDSALYGLIWEGELRIAVVPELLPDLPAIKPTQTKIDDVGPHEKVYQYEYPEIVLDLPPGQLPAGVDRVKLALNFQLIKGTGRWSGRIYNSFVHGRVGLCVRDESGHEWSYWFWSGTETGSRPRTAPTIGMPPIKRLSLRVTPQERRERERRREMGIAAQVMSGEASLADVKRDGKSQTVTLRVLDSAGKVVKQETGDLSKFGFT